MSFFEELRRRNVFRVGIAYLLMGWVLLQGADFMLDLVGAPEWVIRALAVVLVVGLPVVLFFAWAYEMTPEGLKREADVDRARSITNSTGRKLDRTIIVFLAAAVALLLVERIWNPAAPETGSGYLGSESNLPQGGPAQRGTPGDLTLTPNIADATRGSSTLTQRQKSVAVLPFVAFSSGPDDGYFADGLTEEILNALAQLPELLVTARTSAFSFKGRDLPVQEIAAALGVDNVVEGSVRRSGDRLRVTAQLVRASDGFHLWSENYDSTDADVIAVQEDIAVQIARALDVVLDDTRREAMREAGLRDVEAFIEFQKGNEAFVAAHGEQDAVAGLLLANTHFDRVLERVPGYPPALMAHADAFAHIVFNAPLGELTEAPDAPDARTAYELAVADYGAAIASARSFEERNAFEFDLALLTGQLAGIRQRLELIMASESCDSHSAWADQVANVFGQARAMRRRLEEVIACDPLRATIHFSVARSAMWDGDAQGALEVIERARQDGIGHNWLDFMDTWANLALGRLETADSVVRQRIKDPSAMTSAALMVAAAQGDRERADALFRHYETEQLGGDFTRLHYLAQTGQREAANQLATRIDAGSMDPLPLIVATSWCMCGAPFDLEATPNFAAEVAEGDLPWPPPTIVGFPLKDW